MYNQLVEAERYEHISDALKEEFGEPKTPKTEAESETIEELKPKKYKKSKKGVK